jgi:hypothetical protein
MVMARDKMKGLKPTAAAAVPPLASGSIAGSSSHYRSLAADSAGFP